MHEKLLTYGLKDDKLIPIDEVESGLKCECICPYCKVKLIARKGKIKIHHFAHDRGADCGKAYETALHLLAKEIVKERKTIILPECYPSKNYYADSKFKHPQRVINFSDVELEELIELDEIVIKPDALCISNDIELLVEFAVTHFVDSDKLNKIRKLNKNCIEIDISSIELNKDKLIKAIENIVENKKWIYNYELEEEYKIFLANHITETRGLIDKAIKETNIFRIPKFDKADLTAKKLVNVSKERSDEKNKLKEQYLEKLNNYDISSKEFNFIRQEFLNNYFEGNNSFDLIEFDNIFDEDADIFKKQINNIDFKGFEPNYILTKNDTHLYCQLSWNVGINSKPKIKLEKKSLGVPFIAIILNKFSYTLQELIEIIHESSSFITWISNPKKEAEISKRLKEEREEAIRKKQKEKEEFDKKEAYYHSEISRYSTDTNCKIYKIRFEEEFAKYCPKPKKTILEEFKNTNFYSHPILKRIIDGEFWNGKKYGEYERGHIFLNKEKIYIYKEYRLSNGELINTDHKSCNLFYAGIKHLQEALENSSGNCKKCKHLVKLLTSGLETTVVCGY